MQAALLGCTRNFSTKFINRSFVREQSTVSWSIFHTSIALFVCKNDVSKAHELLQKNKRLKAVEKHVEKLWSGGSPRDDLIQTEEEIQVRLYRYRRD